MNATNETMYRVYIPRLGTFIAATGHETSETKDRRFAARFATVEEAEGAASSWEFGTEILDDADDVVATTVG